jgi:predicted DsbA family dithiol-disulfide isomerase
MVNQPIKVDIYYDYGCPYVHAAAVWIAEVKRQLDEQLQLTWRCFPLEQVNSAEGPDWKLWEQPIDTPSLGRGAFLGAIAARKQGEEAFDRYHNGLLHAKHVDGKNHGRRSVLMGIAEDAGLDLDAFAAALDNPELLVEIGRDYETGRNEHGVFGTPTFVFENGASAYLKMRPPAPAEEALSVWESFVATVCDRPYISEIKRPTKP